MKPSSPPWWTVRVFGHTLKLFKVHHGMACFKTDKAPFLKAYHCPNGRDPWVLQVCSSEGFCSTVHDCHTLEEAEFRMKQELTREIARRQILLSELMLSGVVGSPYEALAPSP